MTASLRRSINSICLGVVLATAGLSVAAPPDPIETVGKSATEWVRIRSETVRLKSEWASQRELLESSVTALEQRARNLEDKRALLQAKTAKDREENDKMETRNQALAGDLDTVEIRLKATQDQLLQLRSSLPPRLSAALEMPYRSLAAPALTPGERMQFAMTILNRCVQFNHLISSGEEVVVIESEPAPRSLEVIYWGLSQGYALDRKGRKAWVGSPGKQSWQWAAHPEAVEEVARIIDVYDGKADPSLVAVPARLLHPKVELPRS